MPRGCWSLAVTVLAGCAATSSASYSLYVPSFSAYPDYTGSLSVGGIVAIQEVSDGTQLLMWNLTGADSNCTSGSACGLHVHSGTTCAEAANVGGHYYNESLSSDPWSSIVYEADGDGAASGYVEVQTALALSDLTGNAFVIHDLAGDRIACGIIVALTTTLVSELVPYPDYDGSLAITGSLTFADPGSTDTILTYNLTGVNPSCTSTMMCGMHIHEGTDCDTAADIGGHYYSSALSSDPWNAVMYGDDSGSGDVVGVAYVMTGLSFSEILGRTFVVHDVDGSRVACGVLGTSQPTTVSMAATRSAAAALTAAFGLAGLAYFAAA